MHFPTVALIGRYQDTGLDAPLRALALALRQAGRQLLVDADTARNTGLTEFPAASLEEIGQNASLAVVMGGDGTVLGAARHLAPFGVPLVGINHGRLGFITDIPLQDCRPRWRACWKAASRSRNACCSRAAPGAANSSCIRPPR